MSSNHKDGSTTWYTNQNHTFCCLEDPLRIRSLQKRLNRCAYKRGGRNHFRLTETIFLLLAVTGSLWYCMCELLGWLTQALQCTCVLNLLLFGQFSCFVMYRQCTSFHYMSYYTHLWTAIIIIAHAQL